MSLFVWVNYYGVDQTEHFEEFPYTAQSPLTREYINFLEEADIWKEVEAIAELAETSKTRTMGQLLFDLVPLFASPSRLFADWMIDVTNEYHWVKNWNVSPGRLDDVSAFRLDCWTIIDNEMSRIMSVEKENHGS